MQNNGRKIVILGGGFGGIYTYLNLHKKFHRSDEKFSLTLINKDNYFLFTPLLHEVATGSVNQSNVVQPIRQILDNCQHNFIQAEIKSVDDINKVVITNRCQVSYDILIIALGSKTRVINGISENTFSLKTLDDAKKIKNRIIESFEKACMTRDKLERKKWLSFAVLGGGATGAELAAEISEFSGKTLLKLYPKLNREDLKVYLISSQQELITNFDPELRQKTKKILEKKSNLILHLGKKVTKIENDLIFLDSGERLDTGTVVSTLGAEANELKFNSPILKNKSNQLVVDDYLRLKNKTDIYAVGDIAQTEEGTLQQSAQSAEAQARLVARNVIAQIHNKELEKFKFKEKGQLLSLGNWEAVAKIGKIKFSGKFAWWVWRTIYASKLIGFANKVRVVVDWTMDIFYPRDTSKLLE